MAAYFFRKVVLSDCDANKVVVQVFDILNEIIDSS